MVRLAQTVHLYYTDTNSVSKRNESSFHLSLVTLVFHHVHLYCTDTNTVTKQTETRFHMTYSPRSSIRCIQDDFHAYGTSAQTAHLSCVKNSTISKRTKMRFHLGLVTYEFHEVRPIQFLSLWYVRCEPCTDIAHTLTLSPNRPK
jgi:hypothetical protein